MAVSVCAPVHLLHDEHLAHLGDSCCLHARFYIGRIHECLHLVRAFLYREHCHNVGIIHVTQHLERDFASRLALLDASVIPFLPPLVILDLEPDMYMCDNQKYLLMFIL